MTKKNCFHCNDEYLEMQEARLARQDQIRKHQRALAKKDPDIKNQPEIIEALKADIGDTEVLNPAIPVPEPEEAPKEDKVAAKFTPADIESDVPAEEPVYKPVEEEEEAPVFVDGVKDEAVTPAKAKTTTKKAPAKTETES